MRVLDKGHQYALQHLESNGEEVLTFVKRSGGPAQYEKDYPGTTTQEAIRALIERTKFVDQLLPCIENQAALICLRSALYWLERRAYLRRIQKLNRVNEPHKADTVPFSTSSIEDYPICWTCGHIFCGDH